MRILVLFGNIPLLGKERGNIQALKTLEEQGAEVLFATHEEWGHEAIQPMLDELGLAWEPVAVARPLRKAMTLGDLFRVGRDVIAGWWGVLRLAWQFQPTHIHTLNEYQSLYNLPVLWLLRRPIVYRLGDAPIQTPRFLGVLWRRLVAPTADAFVCVSEYIREQVIAAGAPEEKTRVIYSYPSPRPRRVGSGESLVDPFEGQTVLYVGQLTKDKGVDLLVEAAIDLCRDRDDVRFLIAGDYTWQNPFAEGLMRKVEGLGLETRIRFLGYVEDVPGLLAAADLHACPSVWEEPLSNTVVEAKQAGVPSLVFASGGLPEMITQGVDGWVCTAKTADCLKEVVDRFLSMVAADKEAMGVAARRSMERLGITKEAFAQAWVEVYAEAAQRHEGRGTGRPEPRPPQSDSAFSSSSLAS